jgi:hypothetical protein
VQNSALMEGGSDGSPRARVGVQIALGKEDETDDDPVTPESEVVKAKLEAHNIKQMGTLLKVKKTTRRRTLEKKKKKKKKKKDGREFAWSDTQSKVLCVCGGCYFCVVVCCIVWGSHKNTCLKRICVLRADIGLC